MTEHKFEVVDDYTVKYDGDYFDLHKPSDIRSLVTVANYIVTENEQLREENNLLKNSEAVTDQKELQNLIFQTIINLIDEKIKKYQCNASKLAILKELREELPL